MTDENKIVCGRNELGQVQAEVMIEGDFRNIQFLRLRRRLLDIQDTPISDVKYVCFDTTPPSYRLIVILGSYAKKYQIAEGLASFQSEVGKLTKVKLCLDCSAI